MIKRESGIDLLRCVALLFVNGVHGFLYNTFYYQPQTGVLMWGADSARWLFYSCNCLFMLLTGYLKSGKPFKKGYYRSLFVILIGYFLTCAVSFPIRHFFLNEKLSILERSPQFLETIEALLLYNMNIRDAAEHLFVHHNTVVFRINRIKELLSLDPLQKNSDLAMLTMLYMYAKLKPIMFPSSRGYDAYRSETQPSKEAIK